MVTTAPTDDGAPDPDLPENRLNVRDLFNPWGELLPIHAAIAAMGFASGDLPYCVSGIELGEDVTASLIAEATGMTVARSLKGHRSPRLETVLLGDGRALAISGGGKGEATVFARDEETADAVADTVAGLGRKEKEDRPEGQVGFALVYRNDRWNETVHRSIEAPRWVDIRRNYHAGAATALDELMALESPPPGAGGLILLHGPAGTGKTTLLRALAREWEQWCGVSYVLDPKELLTSSGYLNSLIFDSTVSLRRQQRAAPDAKVPLWRLLIIEDADDILGTGDSVGDRLGALLNLTDGLLGHEINTLFAVTTNGKLSTIHPALARPGRCLAEIEVGKLSRDEARRWLGAGFTGAYPPGEITLADLLNLSGAIHKISGDLGPKTGTGQYL